jgi:hypothetical protein
MQSPVRSTVQRKDLIQESLRRRARMEKPENAIIPSPSRACNTDSLT